MRSKVVPSSPGRRVATAEPLHRFVEPGFFFPSRRAASAFEILIQNHLQQDERIESVLAETVIKVIDARPIKLVDAPLNNAGMVIFGQFRIDVLPARIVLGHGKRSITSFLLSPNRLRS